MNKSAAYAEYAAWSAARSAAHAARSAARSATHAAADAAWSTSAAKKGINMDKSAVIAAEAVKSS